MGNHTIDKFTYDGETYILQDNTSGYITDAGVTSFNGNTGAVTYTAPVTSVNGSTGAVTISVPTASTSNPSMDGTASYGSGTSYARSNHVHPTDTSRAPINSPSFTGTPTTASTPSANDNSTKLATTAYVDGRQTTWYATCSTAASTAAKTASCTGFQLVAGSMVYVHMTTQNLVMNSAVTLSVNSTTAKTIYFLGSATSSTNHFLWPAGCNILFSYDGTGWVFVSMDQPFLPAGFAEINVDGQSILSEDTDGYLGFDAGTGINLEISGGGDAIEIGLSGGGIITSPGAYKVGSDEYGRVNIGNALTASDVGAAASSHSHGNITSGGDITASATIANGDRLVINDESASKVTNSSITFGTGTTTFLANNGTWQTPAGTYSLPIAAASTLGGIMTSDDFTISNTGVLTINAIAVSTIEALN